LPQFLKFPPHFKHKLSLPQNYCAASENDCIRLDSDQRWENPTKQKFVALTTRPRMLRLAIKNETIYLLVLSVKRGKMNDAKKFARPRFFASVSFLRMQIPLLQNLMFTVISLLFWNVYD
jgi:hypothetical protein